MTKINFEKPSISAHPTQEDMYVTTWNCVLFGSYPMKEIVSGTFDSVPDNIMAENDIVIDRTLYARLENSVWENQTTVIDGKKYCRISGSDATAATRSGRHHYRWKDKTEAHYFQFEPIKWRILDFEDGVLTLIADKVLDCRRYNDEPGKTDWENCSLRKWLNGPFVNMAFSPEEQEKLVTSEIKNPPNRFYGTECGNDTSDRVYILSCDEAFDSDTATRYGFRKGLGSFDPAKRFCSTQFAKCRGAWWSPTVFCPGNAFWFMRTNGRSSSAVTYVCDLGYIYTMGTESVCDDAGILPVIRVRADSRQLKSAEIVSSQKQDILSEPTVFPDYSNIRHEFDTFLFRTFGSYPQTEIIQCDPFNAVDAYAVREGDYEIAPELYKTLESCEWHNDETTIDGVRYRRSAFRCPDKMQHYRHPDNSGYHYFRFDPIRWRVLRREDGNLYLMSVRSLDCRLFNEEYRHTSWKHSSVRAWLNGEFYFTAFSEAERKIMREFRSENKQNLFFENESGDDTSDYVALLAEEDIFFSPKAIRNGFKQYSYQMDEARQISSTMYSKFMGTWYSPDDSGGGNCFWFLRTVGYNSSNVVYVSESGDILNRGCFTYISDAGIVPEICISEEK